MGPDLLLHQFQYVRALFGLQVASLTVGPDYNAAFENMYKCFMGQLALILPPGTDIPKAYAAGSEDEQSFVQNLALFFVGFLKVDSSTWWGCRFKHTAFCCVVCFGLLGRHAPASFKTYVYREGFEDAFLTGLASLTGILAVGKGEVGSHA